MQTVYFVIPESRKEHIDKFLMKVLFRVTERLHDTLSFRIFTGPKYH